ncbi:MAG: hypothetical protein WC110_04765 [Bacteroidales bacterium]|jgi:hypothetical protein|nr:hypothetical protein [Bacteroidales bacterium]MDD4256697.1 hypothetical protein [Bacteroidales bacterium]MDD4654871.1 hypothetical protein [Bacteroidales bacterium]MDD4828823.1 hypothetical protein [Bacteroidales bacterium]HNY23674.1 hypothetical protein [Bacteroidales bacterium]
MKKCIMPLLVIVCITISLIIIAFTTERTIEKIDNFVADTAITSSNGLRDI